MLNIIDGDTVFDVHKLTNEEFEAKSDEWKKGWYCYQMSLDMNMTEEELNTQSKEWWDGFLYANASQHFFKGGYVPM